MSDARLTTLEEAVPVRTLWNACKKQVAGIIVGAVVFGASLGTLSQGMGEAIRNISPDPRLISLGIAGMAVGGIGAGVAAYSLRKILSRFRAPKNG